jgi:hypothetical protein
MEILKEYVRLAYLNEAAILKVLEMSRKEEEYTIEFVSFTQYVAVFQIESYTGGNMVTKFLNLDKFLELIGEK